MRYCVVLPVGSNWQWGGRFVVHLRGASGSFGDGFLARVWAARIVCVSRVSPRGPALSIFCVGGAYHFADTALTKTEICTDREAGDPQSPVNGRPCATPDNFTRDDSIPVEIRGNYIILFQTRSN